MLETRDGPSFRAGGGCLLPVLAAVVQWQRQLQLVVVILVGSCSSSRRGPRSQQWLGDGDQAPTKTSKYARFRQRLVVVTLSMADVPLRLAFRAREGVYSVAVCAGSCQHCST